MIYDSHPERFLTQDELEDIVNYTTMFKLTDSTKEFTYRIVMSDIHGRFDLLKKMLRLLSRSANIGRSPASTQFIFLGDYIDRGRDSAKVIATVRLMQDILGDGCVALMGNHEDMRIELWDQYIDHFGDDAVAYQKPDETISSFPYHYIPDGVKEWLRNLPLSCSDDHYFYVHAGIDPDCDMFNQTDQAMLWIRDKFLKCKAKYPRMVIHGHTPQDKIDIQHNRINIDTGAVFGGKLTALLIKVGNPVPVGYYSVDMEKKRYNVIQNI